MHITERADRLEQLRAELQSARTAQAMYQSYSTEAYALAAEHQPGASHAAYTSYAVRTRGMAMTWSRRAAELTLQIYELEQPGAERAPVSLTAEQLAAVDDTHNFRAVAA